MGPGVRGERVQRSRSQQNLQGDQDAGICLLEGQVPPETFPCRGFTAKAPPPGSHLLPSPFWRGRSATWGLEGRDRGTKLRRLLLPPHGRPPCGAAPGSAVPSAKVEVQNPKSSLSGWKAYGAGPTLALGGGPVPAARSLCLPQLQPPRLARTQKVGAQPGAASLPQLLSDFGTPSLDPGQLRSGSGLVLGTRFSHLGLGGDTAALSRGLQALLHGTHDSLCRSQEVVML